ncbi:MAG: hypothetical protein DLM60_00775 [Pseudonocardiales bacterium]|nr:hypothetical protein [Actinomycetota bacterium]PZS24330.1 MAG: hypothetical protein DLM60_00775 [Pseudonocardiales bacterium]
MAADLPRKSSADPSLPRPVIEEPDNRADHPSSSDRRRVIPAPCELHRAAMGFTNLLVTKRDGTIVLDPHVDGSCVISLGEDGATALRNTLTEWLG